MEHVTLKDRMNDFNAIDKNDDIKLKDLLDKCKPIVNNDKTNVLTASVQLIFSDCSTHIFHISGMLYNDLKGQPVHKEIHWFTSASWPSLVKNNNQTSVYYPSITYINRETIDNSISYLFDIIGMSTNNIKINGNEYKFNYKCTEFQLVHELFYKKKIIENNEVSELEKNENTEQQKETNRSILELQTPTNTIENINNIDEQKIGEHQKIEENKGECIRFLKSLNLELRKVRKKKRRYISNNFAHPFEIRSMRYMCGNVGMSFLDT